MKNRLFVLGSALTASLLAASASIAVPVASQSASLGRVVIINTGDRLIPGYRVTVQADGKLESVMLPRGAKTPIRRRDQMIAANRQRLFADLAQAGPLSALPVSTGYGTGVSGAARRGRGRQASPSAQAYGVQVFVIYHGRQSPNLRLAGSDAGRRVYQDVKQVLHVLRLPIPDLP